MFPQAKRAANRSLSATWWRVLKLMSLKNPHSHGQNEVLGTPILMLQTPKLVSQAPKSDFQFSNKFWCFKHPNWKKYQFWSLKHQNENPQKVAV